MMDDANSPAVAGSPGGGLDLDLDSPTAGPKPTQSLRRRHSPLADPAHQLATLDALDLAHLPYGANFSAAVEAAGYAPLRPGTVEIFQINVGKLCNMTCRHCHVDAGPDRVTENMDRHTIEACLRALDRTSAHTVDITGGAPELNPHFQFLVEECVARGKHVIDRCNLTVLLLPRFRELPAWLAERGVEIVCSLPHHRLRQTDAQRGEGTFEKSIEALRRLNAVGYGHGDPRRMLTLMHNPAGAFLPGHQPAMQREWKSALETNFGITFDRLIALTNMPISRFLEYLENSGNTKTYLETLVRNYNPATVPALMCRNTLSIGWDGTIYDCDFNQMLALESRISTGRTATVFDFDETALAERAIVTRRHCYGCTAGSGSSCGGSLDG